MATPRFAVDRMLGRLATWLRLVGCDATYGPHLSGRLLLRHARLEDRVVLTRDRRLRRAAREQPIVFIASDRFREQLMQVLRAMQIDPFAQPLSRCARCNRPVLPLARADAVPHVPAYVAQTQEHFARCPGCGRIYWAATHAAHLRRELEALGFSAAAVP